ncbi:MAG: energy-coupling factor transporter transmembrane protein EcfT [Deltaproteobacteria bacterium]|nr:energy-coupling factor transporter transmembrane protein EcfT [Deltaproteobacteria bacterium]MBW2141542.1 energy-coupling factor transporter transmembrane protein EcfT [Deltaproteobacteria bacterium]
MAELTTFHYYPGHSTLHLLDARFKLVFMILISIASLSAGLAALGVLTFVYAALVLYIHLPLKPAFRELRYFFVLIFFIFMARALTTPGTPVFEFFIFSVSRQGLYQGVLVCWRLLLITLLGLFLVATTRSSEIRSAVEWFLTPIRFIPGKRVATMIGLIIRFIPLVFDQAKMTADAQKARGVELRKNPVYRLIKFTIPLIRRIFEDADKLVLAMEARCYNEDRTNIGLSSSRTDWLALLMVLCLAILITAL